MHRAAPKARFVPKARLFLGEPPQEAVPRTNRWPGRARNLKIPPSVSGLAIPLPAPPPGAEQPRFCWANVFLETISHF